LNVETTLREPRWVPDHAVDRFCINAYAATARNGHKAQASDGSD